VAGIDDATSEVPCALFREQEDMAGYYLLLQDICQSHGRPLALYADRHTIFQSPKEETLEDELAGKLPVPIWPFDRGIGHPTDRCTFAAGQRARRTALRDAPGPPGESSASGECLDLEEANAVLKTFCRDTTRASRWKRNSLEARIALSRPTKNSRTVFASATSAP